MSNNKNLSKAKVAKNDEFYTQLEDIEAEISSHQDYVKTFQGKVVYCNCDDPDKSNFCKFFILHFKQLGLKKLITTHYTGCSILFLDQSPAHKLEFYGEYDDNGEPITYKTPLVGNGDFRSAECIELLKESDIVVTNPPFSLFREFVAQLMEYGKQFVIIGNKNAITYKEFFPLLKDNKVWIGYTNVYNFIQPDLSIKKFGNIGWFTNIEIDKRYEKLPLNKNYKGNESAYPKYDNYDAIEVGRTEDIPKDYYGVMGVPITFLDKYNPEQFEIIGLLNSSDEKLAGIKTTRIYDEFMEMRQDGTYTKSTGRKTKGNPVLLGKPSKGNYYYNQETGEYVYSTYARILIRRKEK